MASERKSPELYKTRLPAFSVTENGNFDLLSYYALASVIRIQLSCPGKPIQFLSVLLVNNESGVSSVAHGKSRPFTRPVACLTGDLIGNRPCTIWDKPFARNLSRYVLLCVHKIPDLPTDHTTDVHLCSRQLK